MHGQSRKSARSSLRIRVHKGLWLTRSETVKPYINPKLLHHETALRAEDAKKLSRNSGISCRAPSSIGLSAPSFFKCRTEYNAIRSNSSCFGASIISNTVPRHLFMVMLRGVYLKLCPMTRFELGPTSRPLHYRLISIPRYIVQPLRDVLRRLRRDETGRARQGGRWSCKGFLSSSDSSVLMATSGRRKHH